MKFQGIRILIIFFLVNGSWTIYGQNESNIGFGIHLTPNLLHPSTNEEKVLEIENGSGLEIGADLYIDISPKHQIKFGINYSFQKTIINDYGVRFACNIDTFGSGNDNIRGNSWIIENNKSQFLGLGIETRLKLIGEENHLYLKFGIDGSLNLGSSQDVSLVECGLQPREIMGNLRTELSNLFWQLKTGIGYEFGIGKKLKTFFEPQLKYGLNSLIRIIPEISEGKTKVHYMNIGLIAGIRF